MNDHSFDRTGKGAAPSASGAAEELFESLLEQFDAASAEGATPIAEPDQTLPDEMHGELRELQECLTLLNQAARQGVLGIFDASAGLAIRDPNSGEGIEDRSIVGECIGRFELLREIGRGGYGVVFLARDTEMDRDVALKLPRPEALVAPELRRRFIREAQAAGRLNHPHVLPVFEAGEDGGLCYLVTPYCRGPSLAQWLAEQQGPVDVRAAANLIAALAEGLDQAHQLQVLHRDIKPGNVLLDLSATEHPPEGARLVDRALSSFVPKLTDFGLAKLLEVADQDTRTGAQLGTPAYMAPEAAAGHPKDVGASADIYALGAILYELLVRKPPHTGASDAETLRLALTADPVPPRQLRPKLPRDLEAVVLKCLEKSPHARYASAGELAADLRRFLAGESTIVRPTGFVRRCWKVVRRRPAVASLLTLAAALTIVLTAGDKWYSDRLADERSTVLHRQYLHDMRQAIDARRENALGLSNSLLAKYDDGRAGANLRNFEWYWLRDSNRNEQLAIPSRHEQAYAVLFSPDGKHLYSGGQDGVIRIWNPIDGSLEGEMRGHTSCVNQIAFSADGRQLISVSCDKTARIWDIRTRAEVGKQFSHDSEIMSLAVAYHHPWVATGANDGFVRVWNYESGELLATVAAEGPMHPVNAVAFHQDDQVLAGCSGDTVLWNTADWQEMARSHFEGMCLAFFGSGLQIVTGTMQNQVIVWDGANETEARVLHEFPTWVHSIAAAPRQNLIAAGGENGSLHLFDTGGTLRRVFTGKGTRIQAIAFSSDGRWIAAADYDGMLRIWDSFSGEARFPIAPRERIDTLAVAQAGPWLAVNEHGAATNLCNLSSRKVVGVHQGWHVLMFTPSGDLAIAEDLVTHKTWVVQVPSFERLAEVAASDASHRCIAIAADGKTLAVGDAAGNVRIWNLPSVDQRLSLRPDLKFSPEFFRVALSPDGAKLFVYDGHLIIPQAIDTHTGEYVDWPADMRFLNEASCAPAPIVCSPDARQIALVHVENGVRVVDIRDSWTGKIIHRLRHKDRLIGHIAWSPDGTRLAASTVNDALVLFDPIRGEQVADLDCCLEPSIYGLKFDPSGQSVSTFTAGPYYLGRSSWRAPRATAHAR